MFTLAVETSETDKEDELQQKIEKLGQDMDELVELQNIMQKLRPPMTELKKCDSFEDAVTHFTDSMLMFVDVVVVVRGRCHRRRCCCC